MKKLSITLVALSIWLAPAVAEDARFEEPTGFSAHDLARLNASLMRIAEALESLQVDQRVLLTLRRVEIAERRIAPLERRLSGARDDVRSHQDEIAQLESIRQQFEDEIDEARRRGADPTDLPEHGELERIRVMTELAEDRLADAERRVVETENEISVGRRRIEILDEMLEELLEELDR